MALSKSERDQFVALQAAHTAAVLALLDHVSGTPAPTQGANPAAVQEFIDRIMVPSAGADPAAVARRNEGLRREEERQAAFYGASGIKATALSPADAVYLMHVQGYARDQLNKAGKPRSVDVWQAMLVGTAREINATKDVRSRADAQAEVSAYNADPQAWDLAYGVTPLRRAFHAWLAVELAK